MRKQLSLPTVKYCPKTCLAELRKLKYENRTRKLRIHNENLWYVSYGETAPWITHSM